MKKLREIRDLKTKIIITVSYFLILAVLYHFHVTCIFRKFLSFPCPGCGMTRAWVSVVQLDLGTAFNYHFMFWSIPILYLYFLFDGKLLKNKKLNKAVFILIAVGFLFEWILKILETFHII